MGSRGLPLRGAGLECGVACGFRRPELGAVPDRAPGRLFLPPSSDVQ